MLGNMRKMLDKNQKVLLVALSAFLIAVFALPIGKMSCRGAGGDVIGTYKGRKVTLQEVKDFQNRWLAIGLLRRAIIRDPYGRPLLSLDQMYAVMLMAKDHGLVPGDKEVEGLVAKFPPREISVEFLVADTADTPDAAEKILAASQSVQAPGSDMVAALPVAGQRLGLQYQKVPSISQDDAAQQLQSLIGKPSNDIVQGLFASRVGVPSGVLQQGTRYFIFRVVESKAGFTPDGKFINDDWEWNSTTKKYAQSASYANVAALLSDRFSLTTRQVRTSYTEFLSYQKCFAFLEAKAGDDGAESTPYVPAAALGQLRGLLQDHFDVRLAEIPFDTFKDAATPDPAMLQKFYEDRQQRPETAGQYGYLRPAQVRIEYVLRRVPEYKSKVSVTPKEVEDAYPAYLKSIRNTGPMPPLDVVLSNVAEWVRQKKAEQLASADLNELEKKLEVENPPSLKDAAAAAGIEYRTSDFFSESTAKNVIPALMADEKSFSAALQSVAKPVTAANGQMSYKSSPILSTPDFAFFFRVLETREPSVIQYEDLSKDDKQKVENDFKSLEAHQRGLGMVTQIQLDAERHLVRSLAAANKLTVHAGIVSESTDAASDVPAALADRIKKQQLDGFLPDSGEALRDGAQLFVPSVPDDKACYTAVITQIDSRGTHIEYFRIMPDQLVAGFRPLDTSVEQRAKALHAEAQKGKPADTTPAAAAATPLEKEQARQELIAAWKKTADFPSRYLAYVQAEAGPICEEYLRTYNINFDLTTRLEKELPVDFWAGDSLAGFAADSAVAKAAATLKAGEMTVAADAAGAAILFAPSRHAAPSSHIEVLSVSREIHDMDLLLRFPVTEAEAADYYKAHAADFAIPAKLTVEFLKANAGDTAEQAILEARSNVKPEAPLANAAGTMPGSTVAAKSCTITGTDTVIPEITVSADVIRQIVNAKPADLSRPVKVEDGWIVFRVKDRVDARQPELKDILPAVRAAARTEKITKAIAADLDRIREYVAKTPGATLQQALAQPQFASDALVDTFVQDQPHFRSEQPVEEMGLPAEMPQAMAKLKPNELTPVLETKDRLFLARLVSRNAADEYAVIHAIAAKGSSFSDPKQVTDDEARKYYQEHPTKYVRPRQYTIELLQQSPYKLRDTIAAPSEDQIQKAYEQLKDRFVDRAAPTAGAPAYQPLADVRDRVVQWLTLEAANQKAAELIAQVAADAKDPGKTFAFLATQHSTLTYEESVRHPDVRSAFPDTKGLDAFLAAAKAGDISPALRNEDGPLVVRVKSVVDAGVAPFEEIAAQVRQDAADAKAAPKAKEFIERVRAKITKPSVEEMAKAASEFTILSRRVTAFPLMRTQSLSWPQFAPYLLRGPIPVGGFAREVLSGEKSNSCTLILVRNLYEEPLDAEGLAGLPQIVLRARIAAVVALIEQDYKPAANAPQEE